jgi:hypothetical protein
MKIYRIAKKPNKFDVVNKYPSKPEEERWDVISLGNGLFQLRFDSIPILDYSLKDRGDIKEVKTYGLNFIKKVPKGTRLPPIMFLYSRPQDLIV